MNAFKDITYVALAMKQMRARQLAAKLEREKAGPPKTLKDEIIEWYENLLPFEKEIAWHMDFLKKRFGCPSKIGEILDELGFVSKRNWSRRPYRRYWYGPETKEAKENL